MQVDNIDQTLPVSGSVVSKLREYQQNIHLPKQDALSAWHKDIAEENASNTWSTQIEHEYLGSFAKATDIPATPALLSVSKSTTIVFPEILNNLALYSANVAEEHSEATRWLIAPSVPALNEIRVYRSGSFIIIGDFAIAGASGIYSSNVWKEGAIDTKAPSESLSVPVEAHLFLYPELVTFAESLVGLIESLAPSESLKISKFKWSVFKSVEEDTRELVLHVVVAAGPDAAFNFWDKIGDAITEKSRSFSPERRDQLLRRLSIDVSWI